jgi:hypothetical protein
MGELDLNAARWCAVFALCLVAVAIAVASYALYGRLRAIHHSLRNLEHYAKKLAHSTHEDRGDRDKGILASESEP